MRATAQLFGAFVPDQIETYLEIQNTGNFPHQLPVVPGRARRHARAWTAIASIPEQVVLASPWKDPMEIKKRRDWDIALVLIECRRRIGKQRCAFDLTAIVARWFGVSSSTAKKSLGKHRAEINAGKRHLDPETMRIVDEICCWLSLYGQLPSLPPAPAKKLRLKKGGSS